jgi:hypothetical protein
MINKIQHIEPMTYSVFISLKNDKEKIEHSKPKNMLCNRERVIQTFDHLPFFKKKEKKKRSIFTISF